MGRDKSKDPEHWLAAWLVFYGIAILVILALMFGGGGE